MPTNHRLAFAVAAAAVVLTTLAAAEPAAPPTPPPQTIPFETHATPRATFRLDPHLAPRKDELIGYWLDRLEQADQRARTLTRFAQLTDRWIDAINTTLGVPAPDGLVEQQTRLLRFFDRKISLVFAPAGALEITLVDYDRAYDHLRAGGTLPHINYDPDTRRATIKINRQITKDSPPQDRQLRQLTASIKPDQPLDQVGRHWFELLGQVNQTQAFIALHETLEYTITVGWAGRNRDPHWRWFSDGLANALTFDLLRRHGFDAEADDMLGVFAPDRFADLKPELNLRYWLEAKFSPPVTAAGETRVRSARYTYATVECQRLLDDHGTAWIGPVLTRLRAADAPSTPLVIEAIRDATDTDLQPRLDAYQSFADRDAGIARYAERYADAVAREDFDAVAAASLRLIELQRVRRQQSLLIQPYFLLAKALASGHHFAESLAVIQHLRERSGNTLSPDDALNLAKFASLIAVRGRNLAAGNPLVQPLIDLDPELAFSLLFRAHRAHTAGDPDLAARLARRALSDLPASNDPNLPAHIDPDLLPHFRALAQAFIDAAPDQP
ncbi:MAG: hypothetical protein AAGG38_10525 [Planctomycetota bacterium]